MTFCLKHISNELIKRLNQLPINQSFVCYSPCYSNIMSDLQRIEICSKQILTLHGWIIQTGMKHNYKYQK